MEQDITTMTEGPYWFWPERGQKFKIRFPGGHHRSAASAVFDRSDHPGDLEPFMVEVYRKAVGGFLYASPDVRDWPMDYAPEGGDLPFEIRVCDLPGLWVRMPDPPEMAEVRDRPHFKTPCEAVATKG